MRGRIARARASARDQTDSREGHREGARALRGQAAAREGVPREGVAVLNVPPRLDANDSARGVVMNDNTLPRGTMPPALVSLLVAWAHSQRCEVCRSPLDVRDGAVVTLLIPARGALALRAVRPGERCADRDAPTAIVVHARCGVQVADDAGLPTTADEIRRELVQGGKCRE